MAASKGRDLLIKTGSTVLMGVRTKSISFNGEAIDITTDDDSGFRTLLSTPGQQSLDLSIDGITKDTELRDLVMAAADTNTNLELTDITIEYDDGATITGNFFLGTFENAAPYNDAVTFSASLQSSGAWTYTPAP